MFKELLRQLHRQVQEAFAPGERLPSTRELAAAHGVARMTIQNALRELSRQGMVRAVSGVGWFRAGQGAVPESPAKLRIGMLSKLSRADWNSTALIQELLQEGRRRGMTLVECPNPHSRLTTPGRHRIRLAEIPWNTFDIGFLVEAAETIAADAEKLLAHRLLVVDQDATAAGLDSVVFDDFEVGAIAARHLYEWGHRRFAVLEEFNLPGNACDPNWADRRFGFERTVGQLGGTIRTPWRLPYPRMQGSTRRLFADFLVPAVAQWAASPLEQRPTAFFATYEAVIAPLMEQLARHGLRVPRDMSIVTAWWGNEKLVVNGIPMASVNLRLENLVKRSFDLAEELHSERFSPAMRQPRRVCAPILFIPGESTRPPAAR
ncbi:MAG: substrate-binding domain-containing protein [Planctomycetes bacterium]|nr:substrate-binding domain-containing protein [Planctomycetota bacterium]